MSNGDLSSNFFNFPSTGANFYGMYPQQQQQQFPTPCHFQQQQQPHHHQQQKMQLCELVYTPVSTPNGMQLTPFLQPMVSPMNGGPVFGGNHAPSPVPSSPRSYVQVQEQNGKSIELPPRSNSNTINGLPADQWRTMTDKEREDFLKEKRRKEAFKSALCKAFQRSGDCTYGSECRFAHGNEELRLPKYNHPKYKTVLCRSFALTGCCPYGSRCQFVHEKYQGPLPQEYIFSNFVEPKQPNNNKRNHPVKKIFNGAQMEEQEKLIRDFQRAKIGGAEVREDKKKLLAINEKNYNSDLSETFDKIFDDRKFYSQSCKPRIEFEEEDH